MFSSFDTSFLLAWVSLMLFASPLVANIFDSAGAEKEKSPQQLTVELINSTSITVRWSQPKTSDKSCPVQRHIIRLKHDGQKQAKSWRFDGARLSVTLHDLRPATVYHVRLLSVTCDNKKKSSRWYKVTTTDQPSYSGHEKTSPGSPTSVRTVTLADSVTVTWSPPEHDTVVRGYIIGYGEGVPDVNWRYVNASQRNVTLRNLKPLTQYVISVRAFNNVGKGQVVYDIVYTKEASAVQSGSLPAPTHLRSNMLSSTTALLQWTDPSLDSTQRIYDERYYNVYYQALPSGKNLSVIVKALQVTLYDLTSNKNYRFSVRTIKGANTSPFSDSVISKTPLTGKSSSDSKGSKSSSTEDRNKSGPTIADPEEYDYDDESSKTGYDSFGAPRSGTGTGNENAPQTEFKAKRANTVVHESLARTLTPTNTTSQSGGDIKVSFRAMVQYRITAYVTWPEKQMPCSGGGQEDAKMAGYLFRYKTVEDAGEYVTRNLAANFVLLENLVPNTRYKYQVKYVMERGNASSWSQEGTLDTTHSPEL